jgi:cbb3-type cytochrome oxidase maturation protein
MNTPVALVFLVVFACMVAGSLYAFYWAAKTGQLDHLNEGAGTIFDQEEHIGVVTDAFPDRKGLPTKGVMLVQSLERKQL